MKNTVRTGIDRDRYSVTISFGCLFRIFACAKRMILMAKGGAPIPARCPICGNKPWLWFDRAVRCSECSVMKKNHPHAPAIWYNGNQNAGIRVWNKWVGQFDKENPETWAEEVCLNLYQWYDLGYKDKSMSENCDSYKFDPDGSRGYVTAYENRRRFKRRITGPHCREDEKLVRIFGADSGKYVDIGVIGKTVEFLTSIFRRK